MSRSTRFFGGALILILGFVFSFSTVDAAVLLEQNTADSYSYAEQGFSVTQEIDCTDVNGQVDTIVINDMQGLAGGDSAIVRFNGVDSDEGSTIIGSGGWQGPYTWTWSSPIDCTSGLIDLVVYSDVGRIYEKAGSGNPYSGGASSFDADYDTAFSIQGTSGGGSPDPDPLPTGFATSTGVVQDGDIPFLLGVILVLLMYFFIWHVYGKLFNIWPLS